MTIEVRGHTFTFSTFVFVCDNNLYISSSGSRWTIVIDQYGYSSWGNYQHGCRTRHQSCTSKRNEELNRAFRAALHRATGVMTKDMDGYIKKQVDAKNQVLVEGTSVRIGSQSTTISSTRGHSVTPSVSLKAVAAPAPPVKTPKAPKTKAPRWIDAPNRKQRLFREFHPQMADRYATAGLNEKEMGQFHEWFSQNSVSNNGVKLEAAVKRWREEREKRVAAKVAAALAPEPIQEAIQEAIQEPAPEAVPETTSEATMTVVATRPNQAAFAAAVKDNCYDVCVVTGSAIHARCSAAHLVEHSKNGAAHYTNGLWLRWDIHKMMDDGWCAIDPDTLVMWFLGDALTLDPDLALYHGKVLRETRKPINREFLRDRWEKFQQVRNAA
ncbi:HNH endonuclease [Salmonella enterica subsp. enterica]|nr:HNH endonuclease [Salmonella enterica subsp. enterica]